MSKISRGSIFHEIHESIYCFEVFVEMYLDGDEGIDDEEIKIHLRKKLMVLKEMVAKLKQGTT